MTRISSLNAISFLYHPLIAVQQTVWTDLKVRVNYLLFLCIFLISAYAHGQTIHEVKAVLDGHVFTRTFVIDGVPTEEDWLGPTLMELIDQDRILIMEKPNTSSVDIISTPDAWRVFEKEDSIILVFSGIHELRIAIDQISDTQLSGRFLGKAVASPGSAAGHPDVRISMDRVYEGNKVSEQLLAGVWSLELPEDNEKPPKFTQISMEYDGNIEMTGGQSDENGTWKLSPSGRYFTVSKAGTEDIVFRVDRLTEKELELRQSHYYSVIDLKFTKGK